MFFDVYKSRFPCGLIAQGGRYGVQIQFNVDTDINEVLRTVNDEEGDSLGARILQKVSETFNSRSWTIR